LGAGVGVGVGEGVGLAVGNGVGLGVGDGVGVGVARGGEGDAGALTASGGRTDCATPRSSTITAPTARRWGVETRLSWPLTVNLLVPRLPMGRQNAPGAQ
jgi:hypothetical protein